VIDASLDEQIFDRLRQWLADVRGCSEMTGGAADSALAEGGMGENSAGGEEFGLYRLVEEFTSLRHEVKLQTKSGRGLEEQTTTLLTELREALDRLKAIEPQEEQAAWQAGRALAMALADIDEALARGRVQIERAVATLIDEPGKTLPPALDELFAGQSWLRRRLCGGYHREVREFVAGHGRREREQLLGALLEGYKVIQGRLARAMAAEQIQKIDTVGRPVDPDEMIVVEVVEDPDTPPGFVVDELRRGYFWNDRVLRCAEVRAAMHRQVNKTNNSPEL
jgi:molecular chaperone GrpE